MPLEQAAEQRAEAAENRAELAGKLREESA